MLSIAYSYVLVKEETCYNYVGTVLMLIRVFCAYHCESMGARWLPVLVHLDGHYSVLALTFGIPPAHMVHELELRERRDIH